MRLIGKYQRNLFSLAPISARLAMQKMWYFWILLLGHSPLCGRSSQCLATWIAVKHFCELRQHSTGGIFEGYFTVLMKTHVVYFTNLPRIVTIPFIRRGIETASFFAVSCLGLVILPPMISTVFQPPTDFCMRPQFIIAIGPFPPGN
jgi:hypothetical protein